MGGGVRRKELIKEQSGDESGRAGWMKVEIIKNLFVKQQVKRQLDRGWGWGGVTYGGRCSQ